MNRARELIVAALVAAAFPAAAVESDPLPIPQGGASSTAVRAYNDGVVHLLARRFPAAQERFEAALGLDEGLAEAHNNLAFALRMQGPQNFERALRHYDRALRLNPALAQAYLYRGMLFVQQGDRERARQDLARLRGLRPTYAEELQRAIDGGPADGRSGIASQYE